MQKSQSCASRYSRLSLWGWGDVMADNQFAVCLVEFLAFLGIPYLKALQRLIDSAITQLEIAKAEALSHLAFTDGVTNTINEGMGIAQLIADEVRNVLGSLPLGTFQDCAAVGQLVGTINSSFDDVFEFYDAANNEANRAKAFSDAKANLSNEIDDDIQYLRDLNSQIDIVIIALLKKEAEQNL